MFGWGTDSNGWLYCFSKKKEMSQTPTNASLFTNAQASKQWASCSSVASASPWAIKRRTLPAVWRWTSSRRRGRCRGIWFAVAMRDQKISTESLSSLCKTPRKSDPPSRRSGAPGMTVPPYWAAAIAAEWDGGGGERRPTLGSSCFYRCFAMSSIFYFFFLHWLVVLADVLHPVGNIRWHHQLGFAKNPESRSK